MQQSFSQVDHEFEQFLHALPAEWETLMREHGAFTYAGKIPSPQELLRAIFLYCGPDQSLREVAGTLTLRTARLTDQAVWKRLRRCTAFLTALLRRMLPLDALPSVPPHLRFIAYDGTTVQHPGATSAEYRLHLGIHLGELRLHEVHLSEAKKGESLKYYALHAGDVAVVDQGYCSYSGILHAVCDQGADVIVRWNHHLPLYDPHDTRRRLNVCAALQRQQPGTMASFPVVLKYAQDRKNKDKRELPGTLHVYRMTSQEAKEAQRKVRRKHQKKQLKLSEKTLFLRQFVLVFTSLSPQLLSQEVILAIYRCRWQIELAIKRMKSLIHINKLRAKLGSQLAEVYLYGKILYVLLVEHEMRTAFGSEWSRLDRERRGTWWRLYKLLKARGDAIVLAQWSWRREAVTACWQVLMERPRRRKLQRLPHRVVVLGSLFTALPQVA